MRRVCREINGYLFTVLKIYMSKEISESGESSESSVKLFELDLDIEERLFFSRFRPVVDDLKFL